LLSQTIELEVGKVSILASSVVGMVVPKNKYLHVQVSHKNSVERQAEKRRVLF